MYLKKLTFFGYGPLAECIIDLPFDTDGMPIPLILVGANGAGKSLALSTALDAFVMMRTHAYNDSPEVKSGKLFKPMKQSNRTSGNNHHLLAECTFESSGHEIRFTELAVSNNSDGKHDLPDGFAKPKNFDNGLFNRTGLSKSLSEQSQDILLPAVSENIFAYYPTGRAEKPGWLSSNSSVTFQNEELFSDQVAYSVWRSHLVNRVSSWLLEIVLDSELYDRTSVVMTLDGVQNVSGYVPAQGKNRKLISHLNKILSQIIVTGNTRFSSVRFAITERNRGSRQVRVLGKRVSDQQEEILAHSLQDLSTGELAVFCIFADLIQIAEIQGWDREELSKITGLALIDEADLHLHVKLQKEVFPELFKLMPRVQFVVTTHSPLLAMGAAENGAKIVSLPQGIEIDASEFDEFDAAYQIFIDRNARFKGELIAIKEAVKKFEKPLIVTEGKTDWKHLKFALKALVENGEIESIDVEFLETEVHMGSGELKKAFEAYSKVGTPHPIVFVFDRDESSIVREFEEQAVDYKFQNGVIGMCLKVPDHRLDTPNICIEHLYTDDALQTCVAGTQKRLRFTHEIGFESDKKTAYLRPTPGERSLKIFDQDVAAIGQENGEQKGELAISKNAFFDEIVCSQSGDGFDLSGFKPTLERLLDAISKIKK